MNTFFISRNFNYNDWFILVGLDDNLAIGEVLLICPINYIKKFLDVPLYSKLREWKTAIYLQEKFIKDLKRKTKIVNNNAMDFFIKKLV